jgi:hypothetical protein
LPVSRLGNLGGDRVDLKDGLSGPVWGKISMAKGTADQ